MKEERGRRGRGGREKKEDRKWTTDAVERMAKGSIWAIGRPRTKPERSRNGGPKVKNIKKLIRTANLQNTLFSIVYIFV